MKDERRAKTMLDKYRMVLNPKGYTDINETINRTRAPNQLQLYGIYDEGELIYKEVPQGVQAQLNAFGSAAHDNQVNANIRLKMSGQKKYSFHPNSVFRNYLWMNEQ